MNYLPFFIIVLIVSSCGKKGTTILNPEEEVVITRVTDSAEDYSYRIKVNNCDTKRHSAESMSELCDKLLDDELNNNCAKLERERLFESQQCANY